MKSCFTLNVSTDKELHVTQVFERLFCLDGVKLLPQQPSTPETPTGAIKMKLLHMQLEGGADWRVVQTGGWCRLEGGADWRVEQTGGWCRLEGDEDWRVVQTEEWCRLEGGADWRVMKTGGWCRAVVAPGAATSCRYVVSLRNAFVVSLALADLVVALYPYPLVLSAIFHDGWIAGYVHCQISGFLMGLSVIGSIFNITGIAVNRYCYICHGARYARLFSHGNTACYVALVWALTVLAVAPNWFVGSLRYDPRVYSCTFAQSVSSAYTIAVVVVHFVVPIGIVSYCYLRIWTLVLRVRRRVKPDSRPKVKPHDVRSFLTMFVVFVLFAVCWAPLNLIGLAVALDPALSRAIPGWLFTASYFMAYFNSCLNAVVYGALNHNFRKEYKRIVLIVFRLRC
ncbi:Melatonin receptor type 1A [Liparis tanakae]|uniref:Melatonin receptor type 1A n=1 Tax=Liparis tanakae TaxID=230148 RepID=A0A4Z2G294_9TELE|nr:Melatonin receptor type 1A [Liparis tanakae]